MNFVLGLHCNFIYFMKYTYYREMGKARGVRKCPRRCCATTLRQINDKGVRTRRYRFLFIAKIHPWTDQFYLQPPMGVLSP